MRVLINAISIATGGGFVVLKHLLSAAIAKKTAVTWYVVAEPHVLSQLPSSSDIILIPFSWPRKTPLHLIFWYEFTLPKLLRKFKIDVCFSQTNFLPKRSLPCPSLLLMHQAGFFSSQFKELQFLWFKSKRSQFLFNKKIAWAEKSIKNATLVTVQTQALADKIAYQMGISQEKIRVIPHGAGLIQDKHTIAKTFPENTVFRIGYITKMGVQKDFDTAIKAISILKKKNIPIKLILTLDKNDKMLYPMYCHIQKQIIDHDIINEVENYGDLSNSETIQNLYASLDIFIFPSLCESFGFTLVEAISMGLPVIVADTESNKELVENTELVFRASDHEQLANKIETLITNKDFYEYSSRKSIEQANKFCWNTTANQILEILQDLGKNEITVSSVRE